MKSSLDRDHSRYIGELAHATDSVLTGEDTVVVWANSPVFGVVIFIWEVLLVVGEEAIQLDALLEVLDSFETSDVLKEIKVSIDIDASSDKSVPVDALEFNVGVVLLEFEINSFTKVDVWSLDSVHVLTC